MAAEFWGGSGGQQIRGLRGGREGGGEQKYDQRRCDRTKQIKSETTKMTPRRTDDPGQPHHTPEDPTTPDS